jgi:subtilisin family serine protease
MTEQKMSTSRWRATKGIMLAVVFGLVSVFALMASFELGRSPVMAGPAEGLAFSASREATPENRNRASVEPSVLIELGVHGYTDFFIWMAETADLSPVAGMTSRAVKGRFVYATLLETAERTQSDLRLLLDGRGSDFRPFYIANKILVREGDMALLQEVVARSDVSHITANHHYRMPELLGVELNPPQPRAVEHNLIFVNADDVWALGITGEGIVLAGNDSGIDETHPALARHYRGCVDPPTCSIWDHNYNWWDATGTYPTDPHDGQFHGTWTTGIMVGDDGGTNQIGIAPGSVTIHCKIFDDQGIASDATISECLEWDLAPWDLNGQSPDPDMAPHAINNSWGFSWGGQAQFRDEIQALHDAGILVTAITHNWGPSCSTLPSPGDYHQVFTVGSVSSVGSLPGTLSGFSGRGPSKLAGSPPYYFPDIMAPGESVRSSIPFFPHYLSGSGTSAAGPHVTGLVGLVWQACPNLQGMVDATVNLIQDTAVPLSGQSGSNCGGDYDAGPNNDWGYGTIDALAAVQRAQSICSDLGALQGTVYHSPTLMTLENANINAYRLEGGHWTPQTDAAGYYTTTLFQGTFTATANAYGFYPQVITDVIVMTGATTTQNFYLLPKPAYVISGTISTLNGGDPLSATIRVLNTPLSPIQTDPVTGFYSMTVAEGTYDLRVEAFRYQTARRVITVDQNQVQDFALEAKPCILLVKDDSPFYYSGVDYYTTALSNLGYDFDLFKTHIVPDNGPTYLQMLEYRMVIWFSGEARTNTQGAPGPNPTDEGHLKMYLDGGGRLFLSSQDYLYARGLSSFGMDYLGISSYVNDVAQNVAVGTPGDPIGDGLGPFTLSPPFNLLGDHVDGVQASPFYWLGSEETNSASFVSDTFQTVFFAWPLEGLPELNDRSEVLGRVTDWFGGCGQDDGIPPQIVATEPVSGAVDVPLDASVVITFSEPISTTTLSYTCVPDPGEWAETWNDLGTVVTLTHDLMTYATVYTVTVEAAEDLAGNPLAAPYPWSFTTAAAPEKEVWTYLPLLFK